MVCVLTNNARLVFGGRGTHKDWMIVIIWAYFKDQQGCSFHSFIAENGASTDTL